MVSYYLVIISDPRQRHFSLCSQNDDQLNSNIKLCKISKPPINSQDLVKTSREVYECDATNLVVIYIPIKVHNV